MKPLIITAIWLLFCAAVITYPVKASEGRYGIMPTSEHFDDDEWNEVHHGFFYEHRLSDVNWVGALRYENSVDDLSFAVYGTNETFFKSTEHLDLGVMYGGVTGYNWLVTPFAVPMATIKLIKAESVAGNIRLIYFVTGATAQYYLEF